MAVSEAGTLPEPDVVQGELIIQTRHKVHGLAWNALVVPADGSPWFMEQFVTDQQAIDYAAKYNLILKEQK
jgi:hypothetical protein